MTTISKFYLRDAATPNTGTMPSNSPAAFQGNPVTGDAAGASTARDATDIAGTANPDIESVVTSNADTNPQNWGHRRFVSRPLAARTFAGGDGNWTFSYARSESNLNHNQAIDASVYAWRPSTGALVGAAGDGIHFNAGTEPTVAAAEQAESYIRIWGTSVTIQDGDILVFDISTIFTQGMATAYTDQFAYDGTTEASTTTCASFVSPPAPLTLFSGGATTNQALTATAVAATASLAMSLTRGLSLTADSVLASASLDAQFISGGPMVLAHPEGRPIFGPF